MPESNEVMTDNNLAEEKRKEATNKEKNSDFLDARDLYRDARDHYLKTNKFFLALPCEADAVKNEIKNKLKAKDKMETYSIILEEMKNNFYELEKKILKIAKDKIANEIKEKIQIESEIRSRYNTMLMYIYLDMERFFLNEGLSELTNQIFLQYQKISLKNLPYIDIETAVIVQADTFEEIAAEEKIKEAIKEEGEYDFLNAKNLYREAKELYLQTNKKFLALKCEAEAIKNEVKNTCLMPTEVWGRKTYPSILYEMNKEIGRIEDQILTEDKKDGKKDQIRLKCNFLLMSIYRDMENFFFNEGLIDQADQMYLKYQSVYSNTLNNIIKDKKKYFGNAWGVLKNNFNIKALWKLFKNELRGFFSSILKKVFHYVYGKFFDHGRGLKKIFWSTFWLWIIYGIIFFILNLCGFQVVLKFNENGPDPSANFFQCFYFSMVSLTSLGTEEFYPNGFFGKFFHVSGAILGFVILGILVAHFTRRIR